MSDLGITPEMFTKACSQTGKLAEEHEVWFTVIYCDSRSLHITVPT